jgi:hypothetical protein
MFVSTVFKNHTSDNSRFHGSVIVTIGNQVHTIPASQFELAEADTRNRGDGDAQYEELWIAHARSNDDTGDSANFDRVHVNVMRFNNGPFEFVGEAEVIGAPNVRVRVDDQLELNGIEEQGPGVDPY